MNARCRLSGNAGFTSKELLLVVLFIGFVAAMAIPQVTELLFYRGPTETTATSYAKSSVERQSVDTFPRHLQHHAYKNNGAELKISDGTLMLTKKGSTQFLSAVGGETHLKMISKSLIEVKVKDNDANYCEGSIDKGRDTLVINFSGQSSLCSAFSGMWKSNKQSNSKRSSHQSKKSTSKSKASDMR